MHFSFDDDLQKLAQIPILPPLVQGAEEQPFHAFDDVYNDTGESFAAHLARQQLHQQQQQDALRAQQEKGDSSMESTANKSSSGGEQSVDSHDMKVSNEKADLTLLQWISSNENQKTLKRMAENCTRELEVFDKNVMDIRTK